MSSSTVGSTAVVPGRPVPERARLRPPVGGVIRERVAARPPPAPVLPIPGQADPGPPIARPPLQPPVWSVAPEAAAEVAEPEGAGGVEPSIETQRSVAARRAGTGLMVALGSFYALQLLGGLLAWQDAEIRTPGQSDLIVGYALSCVLLASAFLWRGRWRALPAAVAALVGAAVPLALSRDLLQMLGIPDVWIGQSMTLHVLFPLVVGGLAVLVLLVRAGRPG